MQPSASPTFAYGIAMTPKPRGSRLDRHQHIGEGRIGLEPFRRLLNDPRLTRAAFIAETPIDNPGDDRRNVEALKKLVEEKPSSISAEKLGKRSANTMDKNRKPA